MTAGSSKYSSLTERFPPVLMVLCGINVAVYAVLAIFSFAGNTSAVDALALPSDITAMLRRPWTLVTYMFAQANLLQFVFNMLWLYCMGRIMLMRSPARQLATLYIAGGLTGGIFFCLFYGLITGDAQPTVLMGSSASVIAIAVTAAFTMPNLQLYLPLIGSVKLKWLVIFVVALFCIGLSATNAGGNLAHLGGALCGACFPLVIKMTTRRAGETCNHETDEYRRLLEKARKYGYNSLPGSDKRRLFELTQQSRSSHGN